MRSAFSPSSRLEVTPPSVFTDAWASRLSNAPSVRALEALELCAGDSVVAVVAHPDDETLAMGGTLAALAAGGVTTHVAVLTAGEAALDHLNRREVELATRREAELSAACAALGVRRQQVGIWKDGALAAAVPQAAEQVGRLVDEVQPSSVLTLWHDDPHPDHAAAWSVAARAAGCVPLREMLLWAVHWTDPATVDADVRRVEVGSAARRAKARALSSYVSQTQPMQDDLDPVLPPAAVSWPYECLVVV